MVHSVILHLCQLTDIFRNSVHVELVMVTGNHYTNSHLYVLCFNCMSCLALTKFPLTL